MIFCSAGYRRALDSQEGRKDTQRVTLSGKTITEIPEYDSGLMDKERTEYSTTCRGNRRIFTRRTIASALDCQEGRKDTQRHAEW